MNRDCTPKNDKQKLVLEKGNQITTYQQEPTSWIEIAASEFPEGITNKNFLQILDYRETSSPHFCNDVTIIEESVIQETETSTTSAQTDYVIDKHKYLNEAIKPYFLCYFDLEERDNALPSRKSTISHINSNSKDYNSDDLKEDEDLSVESCISRLDKATWISPSASNFIKDFLKGLAENTVSEANKIVLGSKVEPLLPGKVFSSHEIFQHPQSSMSKELTEIIICNKNSAGNISQFLNDVVFEKVYHKDTTEEMSQPPKQNSETTRPTLEGLPVLNCSNHSGSAQNIDVICRQGDVNVQLKCKRMDDVPNQNENPNKAKYLCKIDPEKSQNLGKILGQCDLSKSCECLTAQIIPDDIKCNDTGISSHKSTLVIKYSPIKQSPNEQNRNDDIFLQNSGSCAKISLINKENEKDHPNEKIIFACRSKTKPVEECNTNGECKTSKQSCQIDGESCEADDFPSAFIDGQLKTVITLKTVKEEVFKTIENCTDEEDSIENIANNSCSKSHIIDDMIEAHNKTIATITAAAKDLIPTIIEKANDPCVLCRMKHRAEDYACEINKKIQNSRIIPEMEKTSKMLVNNGASAINSITRRTIEARDSIKGLFVEKSNEDEENNLKESCPPKNTSYSRGSSRSSLAKSAEKVFDSIIKTVEVAKNSLTDLACQSIKALGIEQGQTKPPPEDDAIENLKRTAEKLVSDVRKKTEEFKEMSPEQRLALIKETTENVKSSVSKLAKSDSMKVLRVETKPPPSAIDNKINEFKQSAENIVNDVRKITKEVSLSDHFDSLKKSAEGLFGKVAETTLTIKQSAEKFADRSMKSVKLDEMQDIQRKKENIMNVLSGYRLFKTPKEEESNKPDSEAGAVDNLHKSISSTVSSLKESISSIKTGLTNIDIPDKSSSYDVPTPPKQVAMKESVNRVTGMFATLKDKIYSIFSGTRDSDSQSSGSLNQNDDMKKQENDDDNEEKEHKSNIEIDERLLL